MTIFSGWSALREKLAILQRAVFEDFEIFLLQIERGARRKTADSHDDVDQVTVDANYVLAFPFGCGGFSGRRIFGVGPGYLRLSVFRSFDRAAGRARSG